VIATTLPCPFVRSCSQSHGRRMQYRGGIVYAVLLESPRTAFMRAREKVNVDASFGLLPRENAIRARDEYDGTRVARSCTRNRIDTLGSGEVDGHCECKGCGAVCKASADDKCYSKCKGGVYQIQYHYASTTMIGIRGRCFNTLTGLRRFEPVQANLPGLCKTAS